VPNEFIEAYFPLRVETYATIPDSGGAGLHRGGNGLSVGYRFLNDGQIAIHDDRWLTYPWGVNGGAPGQRSTKILQRADGSEETLPAKCEGIEVKKGDILYFNTWGGGGWGDPLQRDPQLIVDDINRDLATVAGAKAYGVVLNEDLSVNTAATTKLRSEMAAKRGDVSLFDFGGDIADIKARSMQETKLPAPQTPEF
jgi:N-methylhydantoinase B